MGLFSSKGGSDEPRVIKPAGKPVFVARTLSGQPRMHGTEAEFRLMSGTGALIKQSGGRVRAAGEKPGGGKQR